MQMTFTSILLFYFALYVGVFYSMIRGSLLTSVGETLLVCSVQ